MKKFLEKIVHTIIPHEKNGNIPHILKEEFILVLMVFVGVLFYFNQNNFNIIRNLNLTATVYPAVLADLANKDRASSGVPNLAWSSTLESAAKLKASDMLMNSYFAHTSPAGVSPWYWFKKVNYNFSYAGENLAIDFTESANVERAWLNSPKHRENIMNAHFTEVGIATVDGVFEGKQTTFVVEFFGKPSSIKAIEKPTINKKLAVDNTTQVVTPTVAGASTENIPEEEAVTTLEETKDFIVVKNENVVEGALPVVSDNTNSKQLSTWYYRLIVNPTYFIKIIYLIIFVFVLIAILLLLSKEYKENHKKHFTLGIILITIVVILFYIISLNHTNLFIR